MHVTIGVESDREIRTALPVDWGTQAEVDHVSC